MDNQSNQEQAKATEEAMPINTMDQLAFLVASWFDGSHAQITQMMEVPDGTPITIQFTEDGPSEEVVLTGEALKGFRAAMVVAANIFGELPFAANVPVDEAEAASDMEVNESGRLQLEPSNDDPAPQG